MQGTPFGQYRLLESLGRGGMGEVWRAYDTVTERVVALKVVHPHLSRDRTYLQRFRREAHAATRLNNRHVIPIHTYGEIDGQLYLDMRLVEGHDLESLLRDGPLEPSRAVGIVEQVALALHAAHESGLVHRDVKPSNILLESDDFAYLIDFGIARVVADTDMTGSGNVIGTWGYMAPERFTNPEIDARSDVYSLACVLYECLTGSRPFPGDSPELQFGGHLSTAPPRPSTNRPWIPTGFDTVIENGMAKTPQKRYQTALELAAAARDAATVPTAPPNSEDPLTRPAFGFNELSQPATVTHQRDLSSDVTRLRPAPSVETQVSSARQVPSRTRWRRKRILVSVCATAVIVTATAVTAVVLRDRPTESSAPSTPPGTFRTDGEAVAVAQPDPSLASMPAVVTTIPSVLKVRSVAPGCQQVNVGSGIVVAPNRVVSTAFNLAGSAVVSVEAEGRAYDATVVSYDPAADIAVLDVAGLPSPPLAFDSEEVPTGTNAIVLGYPGGGDFTATPARIREIIQLHGPDVYRTATVVREIYTFRGTVRQGSSGGPLIDTNGHVLGVVLAGDANDVETGYALTSTEVSRHLAKVGGTEKVSTGECVAH